MADTDFLEIGKNINDRLNQRLKTNPTNAGNISSDDDVTGIGKSLNDRLNKSLNIAAPPEQTPSVKTEPEKKKEKKSGTSFGAFLRSLAATPENLASSVIQGVQGQSGASVADPDIADRFVNWVDERNKARSEKYAGTGDFIPGLISKQDLAELAQNLGFSISSLGASAAGGAAAGSVVPGPGTLAGGVTGIIGGMVGGGASAYRMQAYQTMNDWLKKKNEESIRQFGRGISKEEENAFKKQFKSLATETGLWEAGPEAIGNALELAFAFGKGTLPGRIASFMPKGMAGKALTAAGRVTGVLGTEEATETVTQMGQHNVEVKAGQSPEPMRQWASGDDWLKSAGEVLPQVVLLSGLMSAGGATYRKVTGNKEQEQYYKNIAKQTGLEEDIKQWKADNVTDKEIASRVSDRLDEYRKTILPTINAKLNDGQKMPDIPDEIDAAGMVKYVLKPDAAPTGKKISSARDRIFRSMGMRPKNTAAPSADQAPMTTSMGESKTIVTESTRQDKLDEQEAKQTKNTFDAVINEDLNNQAEMDAARQAEDARRNEETARIAQQEAQRVNAAVADAQAQGDSLKTSLAGDDARKQKIVDDVLNLTEKRLRTAVQKETGLTIAPSGPGIYSIETPDGPQPMNLFQIRQTLAQKRIAKLDAKDTKAAEEAQAISAASLRQEEKKEIQRQSAALKAARTALKPTPEQIELLAANRDQLNDQEIKWLDRLSAPIAPKAVQGSTFKVQGNKTKEPWQMTKAEFKKDQTRELYGDPDSYSYKRKIDNVNNAHKASVIRALKNGEKIPPEVLKDYPEQKELDSGLRRNDKEKSGNDKEKSGNDNTRENPDYRPGNIADSQEHIQALIPLMIADLDNSGGAALAHNAEEKTTTRLSAGIGWLTAANKGGIKVDRAEARTVLTKVQSKETLTPRQQEIFDAIVDAADQQTGGKMAEALHWAGKGFVPADGRKLNADDLVEGDRFVIANEEFAVTDIDEEGDVTMKDGTIRTVRKGTTINDVDYIKRNEEAESFNPEEFNEEENPPASPFKKGGELEEAPPAERRKDLTRRKAIDEMTDEEKTAALRYNEKSGLLSERTFKENPRLKYQAAIDGDSLGAINDNFGHEAGDALLSLWGEALRASGIETAYHFHGDEMWLEHDDKKTLEAGIKKAYDYLNENPIEVTALKTGYTYYLHGGFSYGIGTDAKSADKALYQNKQTRLDAGERAEKGTLPPRIYSADAGVGVHQDRRENLSETEEVTPTELKYVWQANKEGGQTIGNKEIIRTPTFEDFEKEILPRTREGYYGSGTIQDQYQQMLEKHPEIKISFIDKGNGWEVGQIRDLNDFLTERKRSLDKDWVKQVDDFDSPEAKEHRVSFDSEKSLPSSVAVTTGLKKKKTLDSGLRRNDNNESGNDNKEKTSGAENKTDDNTMFSVEDNPVFFSQLSRVVEAKLPNTGTPEQFRTMINAWANKGEFKADELKWSGLNEWLDGQTGKISKQDVVDYLKENQVEIKEITKGSQYSDEQYGQLEDYRKQYLDISELLNRGGQISWREAERRHNELTEKWSTESSFSKDELESYLQAYDRERHVVPTKFSTWQLPGGENYKELLLTLPVKEPLGAREAKNQLGDFWDRMSEKYGELPQTALILKFTDVEKEERKRLNAAVPSKPSNYQSAHWDEPNVLAHVRMNDRTDAEGNKVLFLEEVQSDWHQEGRKNGYANAKDADRFDSERETLREQFQKETDPKKKEELSNQISALYEQARLAREGRAVPSAPFAKTWPELVMKRMLRYAAENGYDKLAWTTGEQQAERYDLSKHLDRIEYEAVYDSPGLKTGEYEIIAYNKQGDKVLHEDEISLDRVEELVGKDLAAKIQKGEGAERENSPYREWKILSGLDLKVGGEGMKGFYDTIIPAFLNKYAKKWGAKVRESKITTQDKYLGIADFVEQHKKMYPEATNEETRKAFENHIAKTPVHSIDITDSMKESVMQGQPMFSKEEGKTKAPVRLGEADLKELVDSFAAIAKGIEVIERDGQLWIKTKSGEEVKIAAVEEITPENISITTEKYSSETDTTPRIAGMFQRHRKNPKIKKITLVEDVAGIWTLSHEFEHFLEDIGAISTADKNLLDKKIAYLIRKEPEKFGYLKGRSNAEKRAEYVGRALVGMYDANTPVGKIIQKVRDIIDRIINAIGIRTAGGVVRDIETGKIYKQGSEVRGLQLSQENDTQYSMTPKKGTASDIPAKDKPQAEAGNVLRDKSNKPLVVYHSSSSDFKDFDLSKQDRGGFYFSDEEGFHIDDFKKLLTKKRYITKSEIEKAVEKYQEKYPDDPDIEYMYANITAYYGNKIYPYYIKNNAKILDLRNEENVKYLESNSKSLREMALEEEGDYDDSFENLIKHFYNTPAERLIHSEAKRLGYDGVILKDSTDGLEHTAYVIYDPKYLIHYSELPNPSRPPEVGGEKILDSGLRRNDKTQLSLAEDVTEQVVKAAEKKVNRAVDIVTGRVSPEKREAWAAFKKSWNEFWKPFSTVANGDKILANRYEAMGNVAKAVRFIESIQEQLNAYPDEVKKDMFRFLDGQIPLELLPEDARSLAENIRKRTEIIGEMLADRGIISKETFESHKGKYIHYMYAKHIVGDDAPVGITSSGKLDLSYTKQRNPNITPQQRKELGLIEDASVAVPVGMGKALTDIAKFDYLNTIAENPEWTWQPSIVHVPIGKPLKNAIYGRTRRYVTYGIGKLVEEVQKYDEMMRANPTPEVSFIHRELVKALDKAREKTGNVPDNYEQLPNSKGYGPLAGAYVLKPIAADLKPVMDAIGNDHGELFKTVLNIEKQGMAAFKMGKVALNIPTACRNIVSNIVQMNMRGRALYKIPGDIISACQSMKAQDEYFREAQSMGLFNTNWFATEINDVIDAFRKVQTDSRIDKIVGAVKDVAKYYGKIDDISKLAIFKQMREEGAAIDTATLEAMKWGMDYSLTSRSIKGLRQTIMPFACVDEETEILTKRGWLHHQELKENDAALSFDLTDSQLKWKLVADIYRAKYDGDMLHFQDRHLDMMLTPDHKCIVYENKQKNFNKWKEYNFKYAHALNTQSKIPVAGYYDQCPKIATISDAFVQIIAWIVTEGHYKRNTAQVCISQNEGEKFDAIKKALDQEFPNDYLIQRIRKNQMVFHIHAKHGRRVRAFAPNKQLTPEFVLSLTRPQLLLLFQTMIAGDGSRRKDGRWMFIQKNNQTLQSFQMMLVLLGISYGYGQHGENCKAITMRNNWHYSLKRTKPEKVHYIGTIWCPAIPGTETWVARRNGKVFLTGNTYQYKIAPLIAESLKKRPWVLAKFALIYPMAKLLAMSLHDLDDDDWDDLQKQLPAYIKKSGSMMILPFKTDKDQWQWVNLEYYFPFGNMLAIFRDAKALDSGEFLRDLGIGNPFLNMFFTGTSAREDQPPLHSYFGTPVYNQLDPAPVKAAKYIEYMVNTWMPSMLTRQGAIGYMGKWLIGDEDRWGREVTFGQALGRWFGFNIVAVSPEQSRAQVAVRMQDLRKEMARIESNPSYSEEDKADYRSRLNEKMAELAEQAPSAVLPITKAKGKDIVYDALKDMAANGILHTAPPSRTLDVYGVPMKMSLEQYRDYLDQSSDIARRKLEPLVTSSSWAQMSPDRKSEVVSHIVANARKSVRQRIKPQLKK